MLQIKKKNSTKYSNIPPPLFGELEATAILSPLVLHNFISLFLIHLGPALMLNSLQLSLFSLSLTGLKNIAMSKSKDFRVLKN